MDAGVSELGSQYSATGSSSLPGWFRSQILKQTLEDSFEYNPPRAHSLKLSLTFRDSDKFPKKYNSKDLIIIILIIINYFLCLKQNIVK